MASSRSYVQARILDPDFDIYAATAAELPAFKEWRDELWRSKVKAFDGVTEHQWVLRVMAEARAPAPGSGNHLATPLVLELTKDMAARALAKMHDKKIAIADKLTSQDGKNAFARNQELHARVQGVDAANDAVENKFSIADQVMRAHRHISTLHASGLVQQRTAHDFDRPLTVVSDRRKRKDGEEQPPQHEMRPGGFFWEHLSDSQRRALTRMARKEAPAARKDGRAERLAHDEEKLSRREEALQHILDRRVEQFAEAVELYDQWAAQGVRTAEELDQRLAGLSVSDQLQELRRQIEMRTKGCGWRHFEVKWGFYRDERAHTLHSLRTILLQDIIPHEIAMRTKKKLPKAAPPPQLTVRELKVLGTECPDALKIEAESLFNVEILREKAERARERREAAGISDRVGAIQPPVAPPFDVGLVGRRLEVCWPYKGPDGKTIKIWASGKVVRVADGLTDRRSKRARMVLPAGALLWAWDADPTYGECAGEEWLVLLPCKWGKHLQYGWRYDPCELMPQGGLRPQGEPKPPPCEPEIDEHASDYEYLTE